jgi:hypothetical protein
MSLVGSFISLPKRAFTFGLTFKLLVQVCNQNASEAVAGFEGSCTRYINAAVFL